MPTNTWRIGDSSTTKRSQRPTARTTTTTMALMALPPNYPRKSYVLLSRSLSRHVYLSDVAVLSSVPQPPRPYVELIWPERLAAKGRAPSRERAPRRRRCAPSASANSPSQATQEKAFAAPHLTTCAPNVLAFTSSRYLATSRHRTHPSVRCVEVRCLLTTLRLSSIPSSRLKSRPLLLSVPSSRMNVLPNVLSAKTLKYRRLPAIVSGGAVAADRGPVSSVMPVFPLLFRSTILRRVLMRFARS